MSTEDRLRTDERARRVRANEHRGDVVDGSGSAIPSRRFDQVISLRLDPGVVVALRDLAEKRGTSVSDLLRQGALLILAKDSAAASPTVTFHIEHHRLPAASAGTSYDSRGIAVEYTQPAVSGSNASVSV